MSENARGFHRIVIVIDRYRQVAGFVGKEVRKKNATGGSPPWMKALFSGKYALFRDAISLAHRLLFSQKTFRAHASGVTAVPTDANL